MRRLQRIWSPIAAMAIFSGCLNASLAQQPAAERDTLDGYGLSKLQVGPLDWPQWGGSSLRNNVAQGRNMSIDWVAPSESHGAKNIKWSAALGRVCYSSPVIANGKVFIGTNNGSGRLQRFQPEVDLGCLLCFDERSGRFLWQHSNLKLPSGRVHDYPLQGVSSVPCVDGERLWYVSNRGEVVCLDTEGFRDGENDGPYRDEDLVADDEADVVWKFDMMAKFGTRQHNACTCSPTCAGDILFVATSNGVDESHRRLPAPHAPAFAAFDRNTGKVLWTDNSPGENVLHGQWSSPAYAMLGGRPQVLFGGGDGWLYSFNPRGDGAGKSVLLWRFDCNPKDSQYDPSRLSTRNGYLSLPVVYDEKVYVAVGDDPEHGEGQGRLWCIDPTKKLDGSDVSPTLAYDAGGKQLPARRFQAVQREKGETARPNPNSAAVWQYEVFDLNGNGSIEFEETMHRSCGNAAVKDNLLYIADFSGIVHCVDAQSGTPRWTHDLLGAAWGASPLIVDGKVYIGNESGDVTIFAHSSTKKLLSQVSLEDSIYSTPVAANDVLYIATRSALFAIAEAGDDNSIRRRVPGGAGFAVEQGDVVELSFPFRAVTDYGLQQIATFSELQSLYIGNCDNITDDGLAELTALSKLRQLRLSSGAADFADAGLKHVAKLTKLRELNISGGQITGAGLAELRQLPDLERLYLYKSGVGDEDLSQFKDFGKLELLGLSSPYMSDAGLLRLAEMPHLKHLLISGERISDAGVRRLQDALPMCKITRLHAK